MFCLDDPHKAVKQEPGKSIELSAVTHENVDGVADFRPPSVAHRFREYLDNGEIGVYALSEGHVVGHAWADVCKHGSRISCGYMRIGPNEALIHYCNVSPECRGNNIYPAMLFELVQRLFAEEGVERVLIDTEVSNVPSLRGIAKVNFEKMSTGVYLNVLGKLVFTGSRLTQPVWRSEE